MSLKNRTVLITRRKEQSAEIVAEIERRGGRAVLLPAIRILDPESWGPCDAAIARLQMFDGIVFTSANAVEKFFNRCRAMNADLSLVRSKELWAVGKKTASAIAEQGFEATATPGASGGEELARRMIAGGVRGRRYLLPRSSIGREELAAALEHQGAAVESVVCYRTIPPPADEMTTVARQMLEGGIDVLAFASPSAVRNFFAVLPPDVRDAVRVTMKVAVIGPTTDRAVSELGWNSDIVASDASDRGLVEAIETYYAGNS